MKKLLIALSLLTSMSSFATEDIGIEDLLRTGLVDKGETIGDCEITDLKLLRYRRAGHLTGAPPC